MYATPFIVFINRHLLNILLTPYVYIFICKWFKNQGEGVIHGLLLLVSL
jgi:hypothetical protein